MPKFTAETAKAMRARAVIARQRNEAIRQKANDLARQYLSHNPRERSAIDLSTQLRILHQLIVNQMARLDEGAGTRGSVERLRELIAAEGELMAVAAASGADGKGQLPGELKGMIQLDPEVTSKGVREGVESVLKEDATRFGCKGIDAEVLPNTDTVV